MAVTKIWPIKGRLRNVIDYTVNPEKTFNPDYTFEELQALKDVIDYAMESDKTEKQFYVTGVNCTACFAREQMVNTKRLFKKEDGILAFHGYQSFAPGEVTPQLAHNIGVDLANRMWADRFQVIVATIIQLVLTLLFVPVIEIIYEVNIIWDIVKLFGLSNYPQINSFIIPFMLLLSFIQTFISYIFIL